MKPQSNKIEKILQKLPTKDAQVVLDVLAEHKQVAEKLKESEDRSRAWLEYSPICTKIIDLDFNLQYMSNAGIQGLGIDDVTSLYGKPYPFYFYPESFKKTMRGNLSKAKETGEIITQEAPVLDIHGGELWFHSTIVPVHDDEGKVEYLIVVSIDTTERKRAEEAMERRVVALTLPLDDTAGLIFEEMFNLNDIQRLQDEFSSATGVASIITYTDGTPITAPSNFCRLCRDIIRKTEKGCANCYKSDAALGRYNPGGPTIQPCMSGGLWDAGAAITVGGKHIANWLIGQVRDSTQTEERMREYARQIDADEEAVVEAFREVPSMTHEQFKKVAQVLFTLANQLSTTAYQNVQQARFIAERKHAEEELHHLRHYLSSIINSMPSMLVGVDSEGIITQWNQQAERATGLTPHNAVGQLFTEALPRLAGEMKRVIEAMESRQTQTTPKHAYQEDGELHYEDITIYPLTANSVEGAVIRVDDVTDRVRIEEMMVQSEKMMSVGGLAAGMAHEINNPLAGMMQTASVVRDRLTDLELPANQRVAEQIGISIKDVGAYMEARGIVKRLDRIRKSGTRAAEIVSNMLSFARKSESAFSMHNLATLLDQCLDLAGSDYDLKKKYDFRQIKIVREYEDDLPLVACEPSKIQQVLLNLLRNGAEAMYTTKPGQHKPRFILRLAYEKDADMVRIEIKDNGPGMDETTRKRAFEPFFTTKTPDRGTGLGLSVSYFIITQNHGGEMSLESHLGEGAVFVIKLPREGGAP
jgi:PAS domain S-box-containing protein